jgi:hypothetical protein
MRTMDETNPTPAPYKAPRVVKPGQNSDRNKIGKVTEAETTIGMVAINAMF